MPSFLEPVTLPGDPTAAGHAARKQYVDNAKAPLYPGLGAPTVAPVADIYHLDVLTGDLYGPPVLAVADPLTRSGTVNSNGVAGRRIALKFRVGSNQSINGVKVWLSGAGLTATVDLLDSGRNIIATATAPTPSMGSSQALYALTFPATVNLVTGTDYFIAARSSGSIASGWATSGTDYPDGRVIAPATPYTLEWSTGGSDYLAAPNSTYNQVYWVLSLTIANPTYTWTGAPVRTLTTKTYVDARPGNPGATDVAVADGGTGASTAATARTNLGVGIGTNVQAWDADLDAIAALATTSIGRSLLEIGNAAAGRTILSAAAATHTHAAADVTTGQLNVSRGGTGASDLTSGSYVRGAGSLPVVMRTPAEVLSDIGAQPSNANLTSIAALTTTATGRSLLEIADAAAGRTTLSAAAATHSHAAGDVTAGTLGVDRGGTGVATVATASILRGAGTSPMTATTPANLATELAALTYTRTVDGAVGATKTLTWAAPGMTLVWDLTLTTNCTLTIAAPSVAGQSMIVLVSGAFTLTWSGVTSWGGGSAPTYASKHHFSFFSPGGSNAHGYNLGGSRA